jgi:Icc-related predicted phosphoesterase
MKVVCISDTHELHRELAVPAGDLLLHAGDFTFFGKGTRAIKDFNAWLGELPHPHKVITCGNHEYAIDTNPDLRKLITNATILINESVIVGPAKIWGSPLTQHHDTAFGRSNASDRIQVYNNIPLDTDIVITHGPPYGVLDADETYPGPSGDRELRAAIIRVKPILHVFGHAHSGYGVRQSKDTTFVNAALFGWSGELENRPFVFEVTRFKTHRL